MAIDSILKILGAGLSIWESKEKNRYIETYMKLKKAYYHEYNSERPDHSVLDQLAFELRLLGDSWATEIGTKNTPNS